MSTIAKSKLVFQEVDCALILPLGEYMKVSLRFIREREREKTRRREKVMIKERRLEFVTVRKRR